MAMEGELLSLRLAGRRCRVLGGEQRPGSSEELLINSFGFGMQGQSASRQEYTGSEAQERELCFCWGM